MLYNVYRSDTNGEKLVAVVNHDKLKDAEARVGHANKREDDAAFRIVPIGLDLNVLDF
jgi:hypothetical protein